MAKEAGCRNLRFARMYELFGAKCVPPNGQLTKASYLAKVPEYRMLLEQNLPPGFDAKEEISNNPDTMKTYCGYKKFLETERDVLQARSRNEKENGEIAKKMIRRGKVCPNSAPSFSHVDTGGVAHNLLLGLRRIYSQSIRDGCPAVDPPFFRCQQDIRFAASPRKRSHYDAMARSSCA